MRIISSFTSSSSSPNFLPFSLLRTTPSSPAFSKFACLLTLLLLRFAYFSKFARLLLRCLSPCCLRCNSPYFLCVLLCPFTSFCVLFCTFAFFFTLLRPSVPFCFLLRPSVPFCFLFCTFAFFFTLLRPFASLSQFARLRLRCPLRLLNFSSFELRIAKPMSRFANHLRSIRQFKMTNEKKNCLRYCGRAMRAPTKGFFVTADARCAPLRRASLLHRVNDNNQQQFRFLAPVSWLLSPVTCLLAAEGRNGSLQFHSQYIIIAKTSKLAHCLNCFILFSHKGYSLATYRTSGFN